MNEEERRLVNFQVALAMAGISANIMTCELIHRLAAMVDDKGAEFKIQDAEDIKAMVQLKYSAPKPPIPMPKMEPVMTPSAPQELIPDDEVDPEKKE